MTIKGNRDGLTLRSSTPYGATIKTPSSLDVSQGFTYIVGVIKTDDVTIQGFKTITRTQAPCTFVSATIAAIGSRRLRRPRQPRPGTGLRAPAPASQGFGIATQDTLLFTQEDARSSSASFTSNEVRDVVIGSSPSSRSCVRPR